MILPPRATARTNDALELVVHLGDVAMHPVAVNTFHHHVVDGAGGYSGSRMMGHPFLPRSPENTMRRATPRSITSSTISADPRI